MPEQTIEAPSQSTEPARSAPTNSSSEESDWLKQSAAPIEKPDPTGQIIPTVTPDLKQGAVPQVTDAPQEYKIKDYQGNDKTITLDWLSKAFGVHGNPELTKLINTETAPLLTAIAEKNLKLMNAYQQASVVGPQYEAYKGNVQQYFDNISSDLPKGIERIMSDLGLNEQEQEGIIEKMAIQLIQKREMSPEARENLRIQQENARFRSEADQTRQQIEKMQVEFDASQRAPVYQTGIATALQTAGFEVSDTSWSAMISFCKQNFGNQKEPISQEQFNYAAQQLAQTAMSFKQKTTAAAQSPAPVKKVIPKGYQGKSEPAKTDGFQTEEEWLKLQGMAGR